MDMSGGYDQISCQISTCVHKFLSERGLAVQHSKCGRVEELLRPFVLAFKHMQTRIHHLIICSLWQNIYFVKAYIDYVSCTEQKYKRSTLVLLPFFTSSNKKI